MDTAPVDKAEFLRRLADSFQRFDHLLTRAAAYDPEQAGVTEVWSVKDIVAHLIAHEQRALDELHEAKLGKLLPMHADNDSFNAGAVYACHAMSFDDVRDDWRDSYRRVVEAVEALTDADFDAQGEVVRTLDDTIDGALANNSYEHYDFHGAQIEVWLSIQDSG